MARTGRLSSDQPNLHNIPVRSEEGRRFRKAFVPAPGCELLVADYNQIELRCIAHLAEDPGPHRGVRVRARTSTTPPRPGCSASSPADVTIEQRSKAKMVSYGLAYGMEAYGLGQRLSIPHQRGPGDPRRLLRGLPERAGVHGPHRRRRPATKGYTETLFGRRRLIPELLSDNPRIRMAGERQAMNAGIQGLAADIFKVALVRLDRALEERRLRQPRSSSRCTTRSSSRCRRPSSSAVTELVRRGHGATPPTSACPSRSTWPPAPPGPTPRR